MNTPLKKIIKNTTASNNDWKQKIEYKRSNKWLEYSSQIARRILAAININPSLSQAKLAELLEVSPQQVNKIVKGEENLTLATIYKLSQSLGIELISFPDYEYSLIEKKENLVVNAISEKELTGFLQADRAQLAQELLSTTIIIRDFTSKPVNNEQYALVMG